MLLFLCCHKTTSLCGGHILPESILEGTLSSSYSPKATVTISFSISELAQFIKENPKTPGNPAPREKLGPDKVVLKKINGWETQMKLVAKNKKTASAVIQPWL